MSYTLGIFAPRFLPAPKMFHRALGWCWQAFGTTEQHGSEHHPGGVRQQCVRVSGPEQRCLAFSLFKGSLADTLGSATPWHPLSLPASPGGPAETPRAALGHCRHLSQGSKPVLRIQRFSYQFLEGEYVWISSKNLSGWCRG